MGAIGHDGLAVPGKVELAHETSFTLGLVHVHPATRQLISTDRRETIEPRVMEVLVALARAEGRVVTRDELILWCWDGRVVGDDAINRVVARIRQLAGDIGQGSFSVETITKVGYRLSQQPGEKFPPPLSLQGATGRPAPGHDRRTWLTGVACVAVAAAGAAWWRPWRHRPPADAQELYRRADTAWKAGFDDQARQAVSYLERAVQIDPLFSDAWGALAVAYTHFLEGYGEAEMASIPGRIRSAARRSLVLDPDNSDAQLALVCTKPDFGNWQPKEAELRQLCGRFPRNWLAQGRLGMLLYQVGRLEEGIAFHRRVLAIDPMIPLPYAVIARALSSLGRIQEADSILAEAQRRWPAHPIIWNARFEQLLFNGRPRAAIAAMINPDLRPSNVPATRIEHRLKVARAVESRRTADVDAIVEEGRQSALADPSLIPDVAPIFALFGRTDLMFDSLERYYLNRGPFGLSTPIGPLTRRYTDILFSRPMTQSRADPRFAELSRSIGLEGYWRATDSVPDYRRA